MQPDYKMITLLLSGNHVSHTPAELHGLLTGQLCSGIAEPDPDDLCELLAQHQPFAPVVRKLLDRLLAEARGHLADMDYNFQPLLPTDEALLQERVSALGMWCDGFMVGFAAGYIRPESDLSAEAREILGDFGQLAAVSDEAEDVSEQDEVDFMELVEYVRMAAITLYQQLGNSSEAPARDDRDEPGPDLIH